MQDQAEQPQDDAPAFAGAEGLRALLTRLHQAGPGAWHRDREVRALIEFSVSKYRRLAIKWDRDPSEAGHAAFIAMQGEWIRRADDPWGAVTIAVQRTLRAEATAERLMISTDKARRREQAEFPRPVRASEHEEFLYDILAEPGIPDGTDPAETDSPSARQAALLLTALGWPADVAEGAVDYVTDRLSDIGDRRRAFDSLRRDRSIPAHLDITPTTWTRLLRLLLGAPGQPGRAMRRGILIRLLLGESPAELLADDELVLEGIAALGGGKR